MKKSNNKGFTLAELLIVVAIIGVLTAVAIPVFSAQLDKSKEASNIANARSLYAALSADYIDNSKVDGPVTGATSGTAVTGPGKKEISYKESDTATAQKFDFDLNLNQLKCHYFPKV